MSRIYIVRHAEAEGNLYRRIHGWYDGRITPTGRVHIRNLEDRMLCAAEQGETIDVLYSSDLIRTMETAGAVSRAFGIPVKPHPGLREIHLGAWEDLSWGYCTKTEPELVKSFTSYPEWQVKGGESILALCARLSRTLDEILAANEGKNICIVSHYVAIRALFCRLHGLSAANFASTPGVANASVSAFDYDGHVFTPLYVDDTTHNENVIQLKATAPAGYEPSGTQLWFRSAGSPGDLELAAQFWKNSWLTVHGDLFDFDIGAVRSEIARMLRANGDSVCFAMLGDTEIGILIMDSVDLSEDDCGHISLFAVAQDFRGHHFAVQLLGQAIHFYRGLGRKYLKLRVAPENKRAIAFYEKNDFVFNGRGMGSNNNLLLMKRAIE